MKRTLEIETFEIKGSKVEVVYFWSDSEDEESLNAEFEITEDNIMEVFKDDDDYWIFQDAHEFGDLFETLTEVATTEDIEQLMHAIYFPKLEKAAPYLLEALQRMIRLRDAHLKSQVVRNEPELVTVELAKQAIKKATT